MHYAHTMLASVQSAAVQGIDAYGVTVEVDAAQGLPVWTIVGLAVGGVKESRERVAAALVNSGFVVPHKRVTVNLAPARHPREYLPPAHCTADTAYSPAARQAVAG